MTRICAQCGLDFEPAKTFHRLCWDCWHLQHTGRAPELMDELACMLPRLLMLAHPDKHGGSEASTRATQWLLGVRQRLLPRRAA